LGSARKTVSRNFRFDEEAAVSLEFESKRRGISVNSLVNNIFRKYAEFDRLAERTDMVTLNRYLTASILDLIPPEVLEKHVYELGKKSAHDTLLFWKKEVSLATLKEFLTSYLCDYCKLGEYDIRTDTDTFVITHNLGAHGTIFLKSYISGVIAGCMDRSPPVEAAGSTIRFTFDRGLS
jgi:hypothetical protein